MEEPEVGLPSNADRAALAKILTVIDDHEGCEAALDEIQRIAVQALNEPTKPVDALQARIRELESGDLFSVARSRRRP